jgi:UDP-N-acetylglucosamine--N-acetylmuramyl-(pentapeptide) pyrophosphoryl-undecaprenol N-acetylglucosamine transferase
MEYAAGADAARSAVLHLAGRAHAETVAHAAADAPFPWTVLPYEHHMEDFYAAVDLVLCRGGAVTISELAATGTPSVIVPYAAARGGEQAANASYLAAADAAVAVAEPEAAGIPDLLTALLDDPERRRTMGAAAAALGRPDAAERIATAIAEAAGG